MKTNIMNVILSVPRTVLFNFRYLPFKQAIRFPIAVFWKTRVVSMHKGGIVLNTISPGIVRIGFPYLSYPGQPAVIKIDGKCVFHGKANIQLECELNVGGNLEIGDNFICNQGTKIDSKDRSEFGDNVLIGHKCYFSDDDGHSIIIDGQRANLPRGYRIGNHVWFSRECKVLKGAVIPDECVVGAGAVVSNIFEETHCTIVGVPARILKHNVSWEK